MQQLLVPVCYTFIDFHWYFPLFLVSYFALSKVWHGVSDSDTFQNVDCRLSESSSSSGRPEDTSDCNSFYESDLCFSNEVRWYSLVYYYKILLWWIDYNTSHCAGAAGGQSISIKAGRPDKADVGCGWCSVSLGCLIAEWQSMNI
jgi:hypothetical protein